MRAAAPTRRLPSHRMTKSRVDWVWAVPPSEELRDFADDLVQGLLPDSREVVKDNRPRTVWRVPDVAGGLLVKHYRVQPKDALRSLISMGRAEREFRAMEALCAVGLPSTRPLGFADRRRGVWLEEAWFIGRLIPQAASLAEAMARETPGSEACWELALRAADVLARLHAEPFWHRDMHAGNLLLDELGDLLIIDLHSMWTVPRLTRSMRLKNLAHLLHSMRAWICLDDLPRFIQRYAETRGESADALLPVTERALEVFTADYVRGRSARCMRNSSEFIGERGAQGRVHRLRRYTPEQLHQDLDLHDEAVRESGPRLLGNATRRRVTYVEDARGCGRVVKEYRDHGLLASVRAQLGLGPARHSWKAARRCQIVGIPTPIALALLERPDGSARLVTEVVREGFSLLDCVESLPGDHSPRERRGLAYLVGHVVGRLTRAGLRHDDMSTKNLLLGPGTAAMTGDLRTNPPAGLREVVLIDLDGMRRTRPHDGPALVRMLGQLGDVPEGVGPADRTAFAAGFARGSGRRIPEDVVARADVLTRRRQERRAELQRLRSARRSG
jgi:tRNA A-37 threonylcarbamoyl transferase component Bud32